MMQSRSCLVLTAGAAALMLALAGCSASKEDLLSEHYAGSRVCVVSTNDLHGRVLERKDGLDLAQAAALAERYQALLIDGGDALQGEPTALLSEGADVVRLMNAAGYDAMTLGNHEFDYGQERLHANAALADFPMLASNVFKDGRPLLLERPGQGRFVILTVQGRRIGVFGLTTRETLRLGDKRLLEGLTFADEISTAEAVLDELRPLNLDAVIAVAHLGQDNAPCTSAQLAAALQGPYQNELTLIIDGHSHQQYLQQVNGVTITQTGTKLDKVGLTCLSFAKDRAQAAAALLSAADLKARGIEPDPQVLKAERELAHKQQELLSRPVAQAAFTVFGGNLGGFELSRLTETAGGDLAADAAAAAARRSLVKTPYAKLPLIAVQNGGGLRANLGPGVITAGQALAFQPFLNDLQLKRITAAELYALLESAYRGQRGLSPKGQLTALQADGAFLQISGFRVVLTPNAEQAVKAVYLDGESAPLARSSRRPLIIVSNEYVLSNAPACPELEARAVLGGCGTEQEALHAYLAALTPEQWERYRLPQGRISYEPLPERSEIKVQAVNADGTPAAGETLRCILDGAPAAPCSADSGGWLNFTAVPGAHVLQVSTIDGSKASGEIYLNTLLGAGLAEPQGPVPQLKAVLSER